MQGQHIMVSLPSCQVNPRGKFIFGAMRTLNLVLADTTKVVVTSASLFSLLNDIAVFIRDSYQRMITWEQISQDPHLRRISTIGETRWWAKEEALGKVFGAFSNPNSGLFLSPIYTLDRIKENVSSKPDVRVREILCRILAVI